MLKKFQELLHDYKLEVFRQEHDKKSLEQLTQETMHVTEEILEEKFHYHFHKLPDANRAEIINMINNYTREAVLPPVVEKLVHRQMILEKRLEALVNLMQSLFEALSTESVEQ
ncbi:MAG: hypothetical protein O2816_20355 [Planctomycetota bacterium]|nr:hypothetical protein [Planctomycetota bacterium]